ncbi:MAG: hypothetical protein KGR26_16590, partial [Cyanobacteria bacterium REEB65]|nr:hypothetical protein [Cyanobacteria bacterium REEB65]
FVYSIPTKLVADTFATNSTAGTETDQVFVKPGTRNIWVTLLQVLGRGAGLTTLSGIAFRLKRWPTTASSGGTAITPQSKDPGAQAAKSSAGGASAGVTSGTGTAVFVGACGCGGAGPGGWAARDSDATGVVEGSANQSIDLFSASGTASMNFEAYLEYQE